MKYVGLVSFAIFSLVFNPNPSCADGTKSPHILSISGHGEVRVKPDSVFVTAGVDSQGGTAGNALAVNNASMTSLFRVLKSAGIADRDIQTTGFSVHPRYERSNDQTHKLLGYEVTNSVTVMLREVDDLGSLLDNLVNAGSNEISSVNYNVSNPGKALDAARKLAISDAEHAAKIYAEASGIRLGQIIQITEGNAPRAISLMGDTPKMYEESADAPPMPTGAGEQSVGVEVNVMWEINAP